MRSITMIKRIDSTIQDFKYFKETLCELWCSLNAKEIIEFSKDETLQIMKVGYWQKRKIEAPESFEAMAEMEHELTNKKGEPVTILKDQSKNGGLVFLKPHPNYPMMKDISMMKGRRVISLMECTGFCSTKN